MDKITNIEGVLRDIFDILHFSDNPYEELVKKNRELLDKLNKKDKEYGKIPIACQICKSFLEDDEFIKKFKTKSICCFDDEINPKFSEYCEEFKIGKWNLVEFLKRLSGEKK